MSFVLRRGDWRRPYYGHRGFGGTPGGRYLWYVSYRPVYRPIRCLYHGSKRQMEPPGISNTPWTPLKSHPTWRRTVLLRTTKRLARKRPPPPPHRKDKVIEWLKNKRMDYQKPLKQGASAAQAIHGAVKTGKAVSAAAKRRRCRRSVWSYCWGAVLAGRRHIGKIIARLSPC